MRQRGTFRLVWEGRWVGTRFVDGVRWWGDRLAVALRELRPQDLTAVLGVQ